MVPCCDLIGKKNDQLYQKNIAKDRCLYQLFMADHLDDPAYYLRDHD